MRLLLVWLINAAALLALPYLMSSITVDSIPTALIAALILGLINTFVRPLLILLTVVDGLYAADPRTDPTAKPLTTVPVRAS